MAALVEKRRLIALVEKGILHGGAFGEAHIGAPRWKVPVL